MKYWLQIDKDGRPCHSLPKLLAIWLLMSGSVHAQEESLLRYTARPLVWENFRGSVPDPKPVQMNAATRTSIRISFRYRTLARSNRIYLEVTEVSVFAVFLRDKSWVDGRVNKRLLDHEQGHFDNAHIFALKAQKKFDEVLKGRKKIRVSGTSNSKVMKLREAEIDKILQPFVRELAEEDVRYDQVTNHGRRMDVQAEERKVHARLLKELTGDASQE
ncbi:MAG TPA: hypothetical protein EYG57_05620 [Planctomycetes bacterium]|nr:hypothetical protein [Planctomycetaceae bacterium]HIM29018.1 hypothetical protein [Planctomycetota bacterium]